MGDDARCPDSWHQELIAEVIELLDGPAFGTIVVRRREHLAQLLARHGAYNVAGDGMNNLLAEEKPPSVRWAGEDKPSALRDWRDGETRAADARLEGVWWRCRTHGVQQDSIVLCHAAYCPAGDCRERVLAVGSIRGHFPR